MMEKTWEIREKEIRVEIAQQIEDSGHIANCYALISETPSKCTCGLLRHIRIALGEA